MLKECDFQPRVVETTLKKTEKYSKLTTKTRVRGGYQGVCKLTFHKR